MKNKKRWVFCSIVFLMLLLGGIYLRNNQTKSCKGTGNGKNGTIEVAVTMENSNIKEIVILNHKETLEVAADALRKIPERIINSKSILVDSVTGATATSDGILE